VKTREGLQLFRDFRSENVAIDREGVPARNGGDFGGGHGERSHLPHLFLQESAGVIEPLALERIGANKFSKVRIHVGPVVYSGLPFVKMNLVTFG